MVYFGAQSLDRNTKLNDKSQNTKQATPQIGEAFARMAIPLKAISMALRRGGLIFEGLRVP
jgi:hypothetical protein